MGFTDDPIKDFERYDRRQTEQMRKLPVCHCCKEPITSDYAYRWDDAWYCKACKDDLAENILEELYLPLPEVAE